MIIFSIDVTLLKKERFKEITRKSGAKALFCDLVLIESPKSEYGDYMVKQSITKEEREAKLEMPILGNARNVGGAAKSKPREAQTPSTPSTDDPCPF